MGTIVVEANYRRFDPVGQRLDCEICPSGCKTTCARLLAADNDTDIEKDFAGFKVDFEVIDIQEEL